MLKNDFTINEVNNFTKFMMDLKKTKDMIKSDEFIYEIQKFYNYIFIYRRAMIVAREENSKLLKLMVAESPK